MKWEVNDLPPSRTGVPEIDEIINTTHYLEVRNDDELILAIHDLWTKLLTYALKNDSPEWDIVVIDFRSTDGIFEGSLAYHDWEKFQRHSYSISAIQIIEEIESLERDDDDVEDPDELAMIEKKYWGLMLKATQSEDIQALLSQIREKREMPVWGCDYFDDHSRRLLDI